MEILNAFLSLVGFFVIFFGTLYGGYYYFLRKWFNKRIAMKNESSVQNETRHMRFNAFSSDSFNVAACGMTEKEKNDFVVEK